MLFLTKLLPLERDVVTPLTTILLASSLRRTHGHPRIFRITEK